MEFRKFLESEDSIIIKKAVSKDLELPAVLKALEARDKPVLFENVKGSLFRAAGNVFGSKNLVAKALGCKREELVIRMKEAIDKRKEPEMVDTPLFTNKDRVDLYKLPIPLHTEKDGGPYIASAVVFARDEELGQNASFHRMMVIDRDKVVARILPRHLNEFIERAEKRGEELEIVFAIGLPINVLLAAATSVELGVDEMEIAAALGDLKMYELDNGIAVPHSAEFVFTGRVTDELHEEGPFVDLTETYDIVREQRVIKLEHMYYRDGAIYHVLLPGGNEHKILMGMPREPTIWREVEKEGIECVGVNITPGGCSWLHGVVSIKKKREDDGIRAINAAFRGHKSMKHVVIVDDDINIFDPNDVEWAIATRFQANKDLYIFENQKGSSLDPSADPVTYETTKVGLDCTKPLQNKEKFERAKYVDINISDYLGE